MPRYLTLFSPGLDWLLQCIANKSSDKTLTEILEKSRQQCNRLVIYKSEFGYTGKVTQFVVFTVFSLIKVIHIHVFKFCPEILTFHFKLDLIYFKK